LKNRIAFVKFRNFTQSIKFSGWEYWNCSLLGMLLFSGQGVSVMARRKRGSRVLNRAEKRFASVQAIDLRFDLGEGVTAAAYDQMIRELRQALVIYNRALSRIDALYNHVVETERRLAGLSERVLLGVAYRYGKDSEEYEMAGGVRRRKQRGRR
jgi:hypothetical protein